MIADGDQQRVLHARRLLHGFPDLREALIVAVVGGHGFRAPYAVFVALLVQVDQVNRGEIRLPAADRAGGGGRGEVAEPGLGDAAAQVAVFMLRDQLKPGRAVAQRLQHRVFAPQGMHLGDAPAGCRVPAADRPENGAAAAAGVLHGVKQRRHLNMLPLPVPYALLFRHAGLRRLVLAHAGPVRFASGDHGHVDRIGQRREDRFHPPAEGALPHHPGDESVFVHPQGIRVKEGVQGNQYDFSHKIFHSSESIKKTASRQSL